MSGRLRRSRLAWGIKWVSDPPLDGHKEYIIGGAFGEQAAFATRREARAYRDKRYGYIREREDLKRPPHCWKLPQVVRIKMTVELA